MNLLCGEFIDAVISTFDVEILRLVEDKKRDSITLEFLDLYHNTNLSTFFAKVCAVKLTDRIYGSEQLRDFVMSLTERVSMLCCWDSKEDLEKVLRSFSEAIGRNKTGGQSCLMPESVIEVTAANEETIHTLLKSNFWLLVLYVLITYFSRTAIYTATISTNFKEQR